MLAPPPLPRNLEAAVRDLASAKPQTRASAVSDLVRHAMRDDAARERAIPLLQKALGDEAPIVRSAAAVGLADVRGDEALPALLLAVEDNDQHVRQMAISALGEIGDARAASRLERALSDTRPEVRYQAIIAYARVVKDRPAEVVKALGNALRDEDDAIRYIALRIAEEDRPQGEEALDARARALMDDSHPSVALAAAIYMATRKDSKARQRILAAVRGDLGKVEREDEQHAIELAGRIDLKDAVPDLERRAYGLGRFVRDTCSWHAKIALARMGHERARGDILKDLGSWRREVREAAVVAAGRARLVEAKDTIRALEKESVNPALVEEALALLD
jgi:HEAT repeat protein